MPTRRLPYVSAHQIAKADGPREGYHAGKALQPAHREDLPLLIRDFIRFNEASSTSMDRIEI